MGFDLCHLQCYPAPHLISYSVQHQGQQATTSGRFEELAQSDCSKRLTSATIGSVQTKAMQVALTKVSSNAKTGPIPTTTSERASCWSGCPFYDKGCYAKSGPQAIHWRKVSQQERGMVWAEFTKAIRRLQRGQLWRHNVSGDLPHNGLGDIDAAKVEQLVDANRGRKGYTYTHHPLNADNIQVLQDANNKGFTINASTECIETADKVMTEHNIPAVAVINSEESRRFFKTESGRKVVVCPATIHDNVTCATCGLCQQSDRSFIVAFPAHGNAKKSVNNIIAK